MKLTKKLEAEILKIYHAYWGAYLRGDMKTFASMLDDNIKVFGSAVSEVFNNKAEAVRFYKATADQLTGKAQFRNRMISVHPVDQTVLIHEQSDLFVLIDNEWTFYGPARISALFVHTRNGWKLAHQHGSFPDSRAEEGEQIAAEKIKKENLELREAVKRRTIELERKNRELEIGAALERVRAVAMGMKQPADMLEICRTISLELGSLNVKDIRNVQTAIFYPERGTYMNYEYYAKHKKTFITETTYTNNRIHNAFAKKMLKGDGEMFVTHIKGKKVKEWIAYQKTTNVFIDKYLNTASSLNYYWYSLGPVAMGISSYSPLSTEDLELFKRFRNVFELAYRRYLDIEQAFAQALEAKIEASLEKVRAQAMSMRTTPELKGVGETIFKELKSLGFSDLRNTEILINNETKESVLSHYYSDYGVSGTIEVFYNDHPVVKKWANDMKKASDAFAEVVISEKEMKAWRKYREEIGYLPDPKLNRAKSVYYYSYSTGLGALSVSSFTPIPPEQRKVLERFRAVFTLAYRRYADVAQAEAQAREAQIEAALERVRSRTMGMQRSDELKDVIQIVYQQFVHLNIPIEHTGFILDYKARNDFNSWIADHLGTPANVTIPYFDSVIYNRFNEAKKNSLDFITANLSFEEKNTFYRDLFKHLPGFPEESKEFILSQPALTISMALLDDVALYIENFSGVPYTDEENAILKRFGKVFQQTYTRFLDLQKAEAQAREAEIQLALERVRARSLAMHHTSELQDVVNILARQLHNMGMEINGGVVITINEEVDENIPLWASSGAADYVQKVVVPVLDRPIFTDLRDAIKKRNNFFEGEYSNKEKAEFFHHLFRYAPWSSNSEERKKQLLSREGGLTRSAAISQHTSIAVTNHYGKKFSDAENDILKRFANVFEQTYIRFLDLQKAEAQAREAQIEAVLERIRASAMAMHTSDELENVVHILREQMGMLGQPELETSVISLIEEDSDHLFSWYAFRPHELSSGQIVTGTMSFPWKASALTREMMKAYRSGQKELTIQAETAKALELERVLAQADPRITVHTEESVPVWYHLAFFSGGTLLMVSHQPPSEEAQSLQRKAAAVFDLAYRRYRDLKKAEAQAREAQIEAALEKVRSRSLAMHTSNELQDVVLVVSERLRELNIDFYTTIIIIFIEGSRDCIWWLVNKMHQQYPKVLIPYAELPYLRDLNDAKEHGRNSLTATVTGKEKREFYNYLLEHTDFKNIPQEQKDFLLGSEHVTMSSSFTKNTGIHLTRYSDVPFTEQENDIVRRFAAVFDQAYIRFLDLQKAEAQAREAQIEAALERVRARTMAMQRSDELADTAAVLFQQFKELGENPLQFTIGIMNETKNVIEFQVTDWQGSGSKVSRSFNADIKEPTMMSKVYAAWKQQLKSIVVDLSGQELEDFVRYRNEWSGVTISSNDTGGRRVSTFAFFSKGHISFSTPRPRPQETIALLERFAGVFDSTYTRFLDLQKAEAQAREAQIEASLERVRSRTLAMQKSDELAETAAVLFRQLIALGIAPNRLYIAVIQDENGNAEFWITDEDGSKVSTGFSANLHDNSSFLKMLAGWQEGKKSITIDMQGKELQEYFQHLSSLNVPFKGGLSQTRRVQNIAYFARGFIGIASPDKQPEETTMLLERFAAVFNLTFTRFNDLQLAEAQARQAQLDLIQLQQAKRKAEDALAELRATQEQLLQQEKLASLGQLTAGIAHEIKNPLNFVNNFSSVSVELVDEAMEEIRKLTGGDRNVQQLLDDVKKNLNKIIEHGTRADGIVKSMLQHSRGGSGKKEPTDLNALVKEYANLAFHGMRAGKNPINVDIALDLDDSVGKVDIIAEDFSRVIINLCQNAFDAMREKLNDGRKSYLPKLTVRTRREDSKVLVEVEDNGPGIPDAIKDKILQPFFTTKKGTQGTGLGLSITHDIVKAHGGIITIESSEPTGSIFRIAIPLSGS